MTTPEPLTDAELAELRGWIEDIWLPHGGHQIIKALMGNIDALQAERDRLKDEYEPEDTVPRELTPEEEEAWRLRDAAWEAERAERYPPFRDIDEPFTPDDIAKMRRYSMNSVPTANWVLAYDALQARVAALQTTENAWRVRADQLLTKLGTVRREAVAAELRVAALESALRDLLTGAEQQSQSHVDVAAKCRAALGLDQEAAR